MKTVKSNPLNNVAEVTLGYKTKVKAADRKKVTSARDSFLIFNEAMKDVIEHHEEMYVMLLNRANQVLGISCIAKGSVAGCICDPKIVFQTALLSNASGIILCHNHPSGNLKPSGPDMEITRKIKNGGALLDIQVLDHVIISTDGFYSFAEEGLI